MSIPINISLFCNGRQKDYKATFTEEKSALQFKVMIDDTVVNFEGSLEESFTVKNRNSNATPVQVDQALLDAVSRQLNQIFF